ncbi:hypothetical protein KVV02_005087 [Mortierella alpina]|uniref:Peptidase S1 domain-containing protein n=1 Tax=Mortierella alpina TaxID=64518 RepID=A0A9P8CX02_MORAP|nr:hypothetical protein KVV02_005087 [Mortierella alpina]
MYLRSITAILVTLTAAITTSSVPLSKRIVNGTPVKEGELPVFAELSGCGGVLIGPQTVLTAAHCTFHPPVHNVYIGGVERNKGKHLQVAKTVMCPEFNRTSRVGDIAVVFLPEKVDGPYASYEGTSYPEAGSELTVAGYGATDADGTTSDILLKVQVTIGNKAECEAQIDKKSAFDPNSQVCAIDNGHSACHGDSGGPLYSGSDKNVHVAALVRGAGNQDKCGEKGTFQYYTFIKPFIPWIKSEIAKFEKNGTISTTEALANL